LWILCEIAIAACDLAEVLGAAIALNLLFGLPLIWGVCLTALDVLIILYLQHRGFRYVEALVVALIVLIASSFAVELWLAKPDLGDVAAGFVPSLGILGNQEMLSIATGILGATVMPHVIYLHSALTCRRDPRHTPAQRHRLLRAHRRGVLLAMGLAGLVNAAMLVVAAALFHGSPIPDTDTLEGVYAGLARALDAPAATLFALALLASGFASSGVGTYAGQVVMQGFVQRRIPLFARRALTLAPALVVLSLGVDPTAALVFSQVVLAFGIPFALVPLVMLTRKRGLMGELVNRTWTTATASAAAAVIIALNAVLLWHTFA
jgi:manganese transport protein